MVAGFSIIIFLGSLLLILPPTSAGDSLPYVDALFTATSAVCVTGLVVVDTGTAYTPLGQAIIMLLILVGSLGFMTMTTVIFIFLGRRISLEERLVIKEALHQDSLAGLLPLVRAVVRVAAVFIICGTLLLSLRFVPLYGLSRGLFWALFHAVSAFGNAGFDLFGEFRSLTASPTDYLVNTTILVLFIIGGLGFTVLLELPRCIGQGGRLSLHSRLVLIISAMLLLTGTALIFLAERSNPQSLGQLATGQQLFAALFTAATPRTAGFSVLEPAGLRSASILVIMVLMFIGASPTSTGGGVKTTTLGVVAMTAASMVRGQVEPVVFKRRFPLHQIMKAVTIIGTAVTLVFFATLFLTLLEEHSLIDLLFEAVSAFGTVGLSTGITAELTTPGKLVLILTMFCGRVGPLTLLVALTTGKPEAGTLQYPEESLMIG